MTTFGFDRFCEQFLEHVESEMDWMKQDSRGDSEIEKLFFFSLWMRTQFATKEYAHFVLLSERLTTQPRTDQCTTLFVLPQAQIDAYRVDFLIYAVDLRGEEPDWRRLIVECDGHHFHERTREQATRDKARDRDLILKGYDVFRFTGSELWRDPWQSAEQVFDWAITGWGS